MGTPWSHLDAVTSVATRVIAIATFLVASYSVVTPTFKQWVVEMVVTSDRFVGTLGTQVSAELDVRLTGTESRPVGALVNERLDGFFGDWDDLRSESFEWRQGNPNRVMMPVEDGICYLTGVSGAFEGGGEGVFVGIVDEFWVLGGYSRTTDVAAQAQCWRFPTPAGND